MKISEMTNDQAAKALIRISAPIESLCNDSKLDEMLETYKATKKEPFFKSVGALLPKFITYAIRTHKDDLYEIISTLIGKTVEEVGNMNIMETVKVVRESYDEVLQGFFTSSVKPGKITEEKS